MRKALTTLIGAAVMLPILSFSYGAERPFVLDEKAMEKMSPAATNLCRRAEKRLDRIDYMGALDFYVKAEAEDPNHVELRFIVGNLAIREAKKRTAGESLELLGKARKSFQEVVDLKTKGLPVRRAEVRRANEGLKKIDELLSTQEKRDQDRNRIGKEMVDNYTKEIEAAQPVPEEKKEKGKDKEKGKAAAGTQGAGVPAAAGAGYGTADGM